LPLSYGRQHITDADISAVVEVLRSDFLTQGPTIKQFEEAFASYVGSKYALAVANGTAALHLSAIALGAKPGHKVITTPITFAASANCIRYCGGDIVFADIDPATYLIDFDCVKKLLEEAPSGTYKGIVLVDFAGSAINLERFKALAEEHNLWILEDACHAPGGFFLDSKGNQQLCGNGLFAELAIFSFHPVKHIACGEGGMITTNNKTLYEKLLMLRTHGIVKDASAFHNSITLATGHAESSTYPGWYMEMQELGYNYRLTDFQAALGMSQLKRAEVGLDRRRAIAKVYNDAFKSHPQILGQSGEIKGHAYHLYIIQVQNRLDLYNYLHKNKILAQIHYVPVHLMPYYKQFGWKMGDLPHAENYYKTCVSLPMYPSLSEDEQMYVVQKVLDFFNE
jgi:UDP-4-amino-4,6-dideoxy-N-acetyl-beta-L-altrosamine transaminase